VKEKYTLHATEGRKTNWIAKILRRNCLLEHVTEGKIEGEEKKKKGTQAAIV
jgi:hypothetical protein